MGSKEKINKLEEKMNVLEHTLKYKYGICMCCENRFSVTCANLTKKNQIKQLEKILKEQDERFSLMNEEQKKREELAFDYINTSNLGEIHKFIIAQFDDDGDVAYRLVSFPREDAVQQVKNFRGYLEALLKHIPDELKSDDHVNNDIYVKKW